MQPIPESSPRFSNMQLELLRMFSRDIPEADLLAIKQLIVNYYAERLSEAADKVWDEKGWTNEDVERMLNTKMRAGRS